MKLIVRNLFMSVSLISLLSTVHAVDENRDPEQTPQELHFDFVSEGDGEGFAMATTYYNSGSPLMKVVCAGRTSEVQEFLKAGADVNAKDNYTHTPLMMAAYFGQVDVVKELIKAGADVNIQGGGFYETALMIASYRGQPKVVKELLGVQGVDIHLKNSRGQVASMLANNWEVSQLLRVANGEVVAEDRDTDGDHCSCCSNPEFMAQESSASTIQPSYCRQELLAQIECAVNRNDYRTITELINTTSVKKVLTKQDVKPLLDQAALPVNVADYVDKYSHQFVYPVANKGWNLLGVRLPEYTYKHVLKPVNTHLRNVTRNLKVLRQATLPGYITAFLLKYPGIILYAGAIGTTEALLIASWGVGVTPIALLKWMTENENTKILTYLTMKRLYNTLPAVLNR